MMATNRQTFLQELKSIEVNCDVNDVKFSISRSVDEKCLALFATRESASRAWNNLKAGSLTVFGTYSLAKARLHHLHKQLVGFLPPAPVPKYRR